MKREDVKKQIPNITDEQLDWLMGENGRDITAEKTKATNLQIQVNGLTTDVDKRQPTRKMRIGGEENHDDYPEFWYWGRADRRGTAAAQRPGRGVYLSLIHISKPWYAPCAVLKRSCATCRSCGTGGQPKTLSWCPPLRKTA